MVLYDWAVLAARQALDEGGSSTPAPTGESRAPDLYGFMFSFWPLALIAVVLRFYTRIRFAKLGWDDITIVIAMVLYTGLMIATLMGKPTAACICGLDWPCEVETDLCSDEIWPGFAHLGSHSRERATDAEGRQAFTPQLLSPTSMLTSRASP